MCFVNQFNFKYISYLIYTIAATLCISQPNWGNYALASNTKDIISDEYDNLLAPIAEGNAVVVNVSIYLLNIRSIKANDLTFTADFFVHQLWTDSRLKFPPQSTNGSGLTMHGSWRNKIWIPDLFFKNGISGQINSEMFKTSYFVLFENKTVFMSSRVTVELVCDMDFYNYPHDSHECGIILMSLSDQVTSVKLQWVKFQLSSHLYNPDYSIKILSRDKCNKVYSVGTFSCIRGTIKLNRNLGHFYTKYLPSTTIVIASFTSFWIPVTSYPARASLVVTSLLALVTQKIQIRADLSTSHVVAIDVWANLCTTIVFCGLIEFSIATIWQISHKKRTNDRREGRIKSFIQRFDSEDRNGVDEVAKRLFPILFLICCVSYYFYVKFSY